MPDRDLSRYRIMASYVLKIYIDTYLYLSMGIALALPIYRSSLNICHFSSWGHITLSATSRISLLTCTLINLP